MKNIGLLGGMSWESSVHYYRILNEGIREKMGGVHSAVCLLKSVDFGLIDDLQHQGKWEELTELMIREARSLEEGGADCLLICTNTMHLMAPQVQEALSIPLIHIADSAGEALVRDGRSRVALLGTRFTMEKDFYTRRIRGKYGVEVFIPSEEDRETVHNTIYGELVKGIFRDESRQRFSEIINRLADEGAEGVILGCTEIPLLIQQEHSVLPLYNTMEIHARSALDWALQE